MVKNIRELEGTVVRLGLMLADAYKYIDPARLPEIKVTCDEPPTPEGEITVKIEMNTGDIITGAVEKFRRENFPDTGEAGGKDHA